MAMISIIVPCYNSTQVLCELVEETRKVLEKEMISEYEFVLVNDCSPNKDTIGILESLANKYAFVKVIDLAKNTGQANAQLTALRYVSGDVVINMDDDMQTHPKNIPLLLKKLEGGYDVVLGVYPEKKDSLFRRILTKMDDQFTRVVLKKPADLHFTSFWVAKRYICDSLIQYEHPYAFMEGLFLRTTRNIGNVEVEHFERREGSSGYNFFKLLKLWSNFTNFTILPLRIAGIMGAVIAFVSFLVIIWAAVRKIVDPQSVLQGYTSLLSLMLLMFGIVMIFMGIIGEYIGRIFICINNAPQQVVKRTVNISTDEKIKNNVGECYV